MSINLNVEGGHDEASAPRFNAIPSKLELPPNPNAPRTSNPSEGLEPLRSDDFGPAPSCDSRGSFCSLDSSGSVLQQAFSGVDPNKTGARRSGPTDDNDDNVDVDVLQKKIRFLEQAIEVTSLDKQKQKRRWNCVRWCVKRSDDQAIHWVHTPNANAIFGTAIFLNAIFLGLESDLKPSENDLRGKERSAWLPWFLVECAFCTIFTVELMLRIRADRCRTFRDPWNVFDVILVSIGIIDTWVLEIVMHDMRSSTGEFSFLTLLRVVRLVRLARVLRILRLIRFLRELLLLAHGILGAMRALGWSLVLILIVLYISAVFITTILAPTTPPQDEEGRNIEIWFGSLGSSLLTLFQITTLEDWPEVVRGVMSKWGESWLFFVPFIGLTNFVLVNVITGVVVERVLTCSDNHVTSAANQAAMDHLHSMKALNAIFQHMDVDGLGRITETQFNQAIQRPEMLNKFYKLGFAKYEVHNIFNYLEVGSLEPVLISELVEGCLRIHGPSQSKHLLRVQYDVLRNGKELRNQVIVLTRQVKWIIRRLQRVEKSSKNQRKDFAEAKKFASSHSTASAMASDTDGGGDRRSGNRTALSVDTSRASTDGKTSRPASPRSRPRQAQPPQRSAAAVHLLTKLQALAHEQAVTRKLVASYAFEVQELRTTLSEFQDAADNKSIFSPAQAGSIAGDATPDVSLSSEDEQSAATAVQMAKPEVTGGTESVISPDSASQATEASPSDEKRHTLI